MRFASCYIILCFILFACKQPTSQLPVLGHPTISGKDTVYPAIAGF